MRIVRGRECGKMRENQLIPEPTQGIADQTHLVGLRKREAYYKFF